MSKDFAVDKEVSRTNLHRRNDYDRGSTTSCFRFTEAKEEEETLVFRTLEQKKLLTLTDSD